MDADQENVVSSAASAEEFAFVCAGVTSRPYECPSVLCSLPAVGGFLAPLVNEFAVSGSRGFSVPSVAVMRLAFIRFERRA